MGSLSFCIGLKNIDKDAIALNFKIHSKRLTDWLYVLTYIRNVCAHHSRLWNLKLAIRPQAMREKEWQPPLLPSRDKLFCVLLMLSFLLRHSGYEEKWRNDCNVIRNKFSKAIG
jgi:abortive infection bacteriophage resistance protein